MDVMDVAVAVGADAVVVITPGDALLAAVEVVRSFSRPDTTARVLYVNVGDKLTELDSVAEAETGSKESHNVVASTQEAPSEVDVISQ